MPAGKPTELLQVGGRLRQVGEPAQARLLGQPGEGREGLGERARPSPDRQGHQVQRRLGGIHRLLPVVLRVEAGLEQRREELGGGEPAAHLAEGLVDVVPREAQLPQRAGHPRVDRAGEVIHLRVRAQRSFSALAAEKRKRGSTPTSRRYMTPKAASLLPIRSAAWARVTPSGSVMGRLPSRRVFTASRRSDSSPVPADEPGRQRRAQPGRVQHPRQGTRRAASGRGRAACPAGPGARRAASHPPRRG